ncbi:MAG: hypothetical protein CEE38_19280 [Planctomycetes bacterium B3_Pla]|nr:MAG: hypothetical protein CEE38_19280 [Planctomycetes bacterium B3_Pla]
MQTNDNILDLLREKGAEAARNTLRGLILQPGAIGDCILTLPLAAFVKKSLRLGGIDVLGHTEYIGFLPGRSCIDGVRSMDSMNLYRLFTEPQSFELKDRDSLINAFSDYAWIVTFMGEPESSFEQNLIYTATCSHSAEVITFSMKPPEDRPEHVADFYVRQFIERTGLAASSERPRANDCLVKTTKADVNTGREILKEAGLGSGRTLVVIHPGSGGQQKCWYIENFLAVATGLASKGIEVVFLLGPAERERFSGAAINKINSVVPCLTDLSLIRVLGLLSCSDGFVGNDSGITHLAAALGIKTLAVFGPTNPAFYEPLGPAVTVFIDSEETFAEKPSPKLQRTLLDALTA